MRLLTPVILLASFVCLSARAPAQVQVTVDAAVRRQTIDGLGATLSGTWNADIVALFADPAFAALLRDDLGISMVRIEIPPETQAQEDLQPSVLDLSRFNFNSMLPAATLAAKLNEPSPGSVKVIGTIWSPPGWMKTSGQPSRGGELRPDRRPHFAKYCAGVSIGFQQTYGIPLYALSPQNELCFWEPYNSCTYSDEQYRDAVAAIGGAFSTWNVTTRIFGPEDVGTDPTRFMWYANGVAAGPQALQRMDAWGIHGYPWANGVDESSPAAWSALRQQLQGWGKPIWVTEVSGEDPAWLGTPQNSRGAFIVARQIQDALIYGDVAAYTYWVIADPAPSQFALMGGGLPTKKYYAAKQFFRYIRPGAVRVGTTFPTGTVTASAFIHDQQQTMTVVLINSGANAAATRVTFSGEIPASPLSVVRTSETEDSAGLATVPVVAGAVNLTLPRYSVTTLVGTLSAGIGSCYANCDGSITPPVVNNADFSCFLRRFAAGDAYANCDSSTTEPVLNVGDLTCFLQRYGAGCP